jgi:chemotaxis protein MotB
MARKKKHEEHENLERWLVSYADFITLLFAFFVVMYAISQVNVAKYRVLSDSLVNAFKNSPSTVLPSPVRMDAKSQEAAGRSQKQTVTLRKSDGAMDARQRERMKVIARDLFKVMEPLVKEGQVRVTQSARGVAVEINASVLFASGQAALETPSIKVLKAVGQVLATVPNDIQVEGYTDNTPINTVAYPSNWELSTARASSVVRLFVETGVDAGRLVAVGYGENRPVEPNTSQEGRSRNRRVTVMILSEAQQRLAADAAAVNQASEAAQVTAARQGAGK